MHFERRNALPFEAVLSELGVCVYFINEEGKITIFWVSSLTLTYTQSLKVRTHWTWNQHDDVIKWKHFPRYWPFVRGIHRSTVNSPHKGQWRGALMFSLICARINGWVNNREVGNLRCHSGHYDIIVMNMAVRPSRLQISTDLSNINVTEPMHMSFRYMKHNTAVFWGYVIIFLITRSISAKIWCFLAYITRHVTPLYYYIVIPLALCNMGTRPKHILSANLTQSRLCIIYSSVA